MLRINLLHIGRQKMPKYDVYVNEQHTLVYGFKVMYMFKNKMENKK